MSLYDLNVRVIVRGKAGAEVEFGNTVLAGENRQGIILDYQIFRESAPADSQLLFESLSRVWDMANRQMKGKKFAQLQRRRAQTEGRIGILKHGFLGRPMRAKGFAHRELALAWGVLTHNLWMLARMKKTKKVALAKAA